MRLILVEERTPRRLTALQRTPAVRASELSRTLLVSTASIIPKADARTLTVTCVETDLTTRGTYTIGSTAGTRRQLLDR